jgi:arginine deiminase
MEKVKNVGVRAEYDQANVILMHTPDIELKEGMYSPTASLFEGFGSAATAKQEHLAFVSELRRRDIQVHRVKDVLLDGTGADGREINEQDIKDLRQLASESLEYVCTGLNQEAQKRLGQEKKIVIELSSPYDLVDMVLKRPSEELIATETNTEFKTKSHRDPLYNLMFARDQMITTDRGVVLGNMNSEQRQHETDVMSFVLRKLGITPIHKVESGFLEGGDYIPCGNDNRGDSFAMIGQGLRTSEGAIEDIVVNNGKHIFGFDYIAVVKDQVKCQDEMHLDTYFNVIAPLKAIAIETRLGFSKNGNENSVPQVDVYRKQGNGEYQKVESDIAFPDFLDRVGFSVHPIPEAVQRKYGCNILTLESNKIIGVDIGAKAKYEAMLQKMKLNGNGTEGLTPEQVYNCHMKMDQAYRSILKEAGLNTYGMQLMDFTHLNKAYGGPHCLTQVLSRIPSTNR